MKSKFIGVVLFTLALLLTTTPVSAKGGLPFDVVPKFSDNQEQGVTNYISIKGHGDSMRDNFEFDIRNKSNEIQSVIVNIVDAYTSPNGVVQYDVEETENSKIIDDKQKMSNHLTVEGEDKNGNLIVELNPKETRAIKANLDAKNIDGTLLGGVTFRLFQEGDEFEENESTFKINNEISMIIGAIVEFDYDGKVDFTIDKPYVDPMPSYYAIRLPVTMESPTFKMTEIVYDVSINGKTQFGAELEHEFAPKSKTNISLPWELETIKSDVEYRIKGHIGYNENEEKNKEPFDFTFKYSPDNSIVDKITSPFVKPLEEGRFPWLLTLTLLLLIIVALGIFIKRKKPTYHILALFNSELPTEIEEGSEYYNVIAEVDSIPKNNKETTVGVYKKVLNNENEAYYILDKVKTKEIND